MQIFRKKGLKKLPTVLASVLLSGALLAGTTVTAFAATDVNHSAVNDASQSKGGIFYTDYATPDDLMDAAKELAEEISEEGMVLMQNKDNALPLQKGMRVSVFGKSSVNPAYGGGGSGALIGVTPVSLYEGLQNAGFKTNGVLEAFYNNDLLSGSGRSDKTYVNETPVSAYTAGITSSYSAYGDAAIVVITRTGAEGSDLPRTGNAAYDEGARYLSITQDEKDLIGHVNEYFDKVIVLVNSSNTVELGDIKDDVDSILWVGNPGERGFNAVGRILNGEVNPSGRLADVYVSDLTMDPTWANFGNNSQNKGVEVYTKSTDRNGKLVYAKETVKYNALHKAEVADGSQKLSDGTAIPAGTQIYEKGGTYTEYEEGIYVGYRYYETRAYEMGDQGAAWYDGLVDFTFGHGESYTTFSQEWAETPDVELTKDGSVTLKVKVTNTGDVAGKEVVQLYYSAPYFEEGIEKSVVNLGAYAKTDILAPGGSETVTLTMKVQDMASFDWNDANGNGFCGYELEAGNYSFIVGRDAHCWADEKALSVTAAVAADAQDANFKNAAANGSNGYTYTTDSNTGNEIKVLFSNDDIYNTNLMSDENKLQRSSFADAPADENIIRENTLDEAIFSDKAWAQIGKTSHLFEIGDDAGDHYAFEGEEHAPWYVEDVPQKNGKDAWTQWDDSKGTRPAAPYTFADMAGWDYDDERWDEVLNSLSWKELKDIVYVAGFTNAKVDYIEKPMAIDDDGPMQVKLDQSPMEGTNDDFTGTGWPCAVLVSATWNKELAERQGVMLGNECLYLGISGWFAPAMNLHRNQYGGRIFEYYSSDPVHGGKIAAEVTRGVQSKGVYAFLKHFCLNNQDTGRGSISIVVNEQAMRELYMYTFEIAVEEGGAHGLMTYYSYVGGVSIMHNYAILTEYVRNQWGFEGVINHDYGPESYTSTICTPALTRRVGNGMGGNGATYDRYADQDYYDPAENMVYYCLDERGAATEDAVASVTHWAAMRESAKQLLWTTANSNNQKNKLDLAQFAGRTIEAEQDVSLDVSVGVNISDPAAADYYGTQNVSYKLIKGALPEGIVLDEATGALTGSTAQTGEFEFTVRMRSDFWIKNDQTFKIVVAPTVSLSSAEMVAGSEYYGRIQAETFENATEMSYTLIGGALPEGYTLNSATGEIEGIAKVPGIYEAVIRIHGVVEVEGTDRWGNPTVTRTDKDLDVTLTFNVTGEASAPVAISEDGYWVIDGVKTDIKAEAEDGATPTISIDEETKHWIINGTDTGIVAEGRDGQDGQNGQDGKNGCGGSLTAGSLAIALTVLSCVAVSAVLLRRRAEK